MSMHNTTKTTLKEIWHYAPTFQLKHCDGGAIDHKRANSGVDSKNDTKIKLEETKKIKICCWGTFSPCSRTDLKLKDSGRKNLKENRSERLKERKIKYANVITPTKNAWNVDARGAPNHLTARGYHSQQNICSQYGIIIFMMGFRHINVKWLRCASINDDLISPEGIKYEASPWTLHSVILKIVQAWYPGRRNLATPYTFAELRKP